MLPGAACEQTWHLVMVPRTCASPGQEPAWTKQLGAIFESWSYDTAGLLVLWGGGTLYRSNSHIH